MTRPQLIFVYNADSGLFNTVADIAHKVLSPSTYACNLCALTHGHFKIRQEWGNFLETLDADCEFLHRDEFQVAYHMHDVTLPVIYRQNGEMLECLVDAATLQEVGSLAALEGLVLHALSEKEQP